MRYFIDTNIFIRVLHKENEKLFQECLLLLQSIKENEVEAFTGTVVLTEVVWTLSSFYKISKAKIIEGVRGIININGLKVLDNYNQSLALTLFEKHSIKYIDALIASNEEVFTKKMTIVSYDRDFDKLPVNRQEPKDILAKLN
ncbi:hypothetical protein A3D03_06020 [Candidatus Gottesmanbacteria bacterium RIFCSPHIGHO2_02_FULL_40_13]|uniref:PIN domain-containing protein n=1 Tax=Candidatus Gottesmanbacteria bacterium RIFCSPHIGHO2_02_FULL_40_13 TaxID=1798384 RepID=A0A1F6A745_9BACT|nr:MAG: hypothetical protein A3D03_06020 [Candidatus Gottesmanbacteria bacterium RIFCSPHIGHO2_02_FULL_40_13]